MRFGVNVPNFGEFADPRRMAELSVVAERSGWDGFFVWDHMYVFPGNVVGDPWIQLAAVADATERLVIGTMVTPLPRRRPWVVARQAVSLDQLSGGRFVLGVGIGYPPREEFEMFGEVVDPVVRGDMLDEALDVIVGLWSGEAFTYDGDHYRLESMTFNPVPVQRPRIPIWVAGMWPNKRPFRRAARYEGVFPINISSGDMGPMTSGDLAAMHDFVRSHRPVNTPYQTSVYYFGGGADELAGLEQAGVDWVHVSGPRGSTYHDIVAMVASGPPG